MGREKLLKAIIKDVKNIRLAVIEASKTYHEIRGDAGNGKSAILTAIKGAFEGLDPKCIREGADNAEIELVLSSMQIRRVIDRYGKEQLVVTNEGRAIDKKNVASGLLEALWGKGFDPVAWVNLGADIGEGTTENRRKQRNQLVMALNMNVTKEEIIQEVDTFDGISQFNRLNLDGIDWTQHAYVILSELLKRAAVVYREEVNYEKKRTEAALDAVTVPTTHPDCTMDEAQKALEITRSRYYGAEQAQQNRAATVERITQLRAKIAESQITLKDRTKLEEGLNARRDQLASCTVMRTDAEGKVKELEEALKNARAQLETLNTQHAELNSAITKYNTCLAEWDAQDARKADLASLEKELSGDNIPIDTEKLKKQMKECESAIADLQLVSVYNATKESAEQAAAIESLWRGELLPLLRDAMLNKKLAEQKLPVDGVRIEDDQITVNGRPLWSLGTSEQYVVGVKLGSLLNQRLGFMLIDRAESIGSKELQAIYEACEQLDVTAILTFMDPDAEPGEHVTVMKDGEAVA